MIQQDDDFANLSNAGVNRRLDVQGKAQETIIGMKEEDAVMARKAGQIFMYQQGKYGMGQHARELVGDFGGVGTYFGMKPYHQEEQEVAFIKHLEEEGRRRGVNIYEDYLNAHPYDEARPGEAPGTIHNYPAGYTAGQIKKLGAAGGGRLDQKNLFADVKSRRAAVAKIYAHGGQPYGTIDKTEQQLEAFKWEGAAHAPQGAGVNQDPQALQKLLKEAQETNRILREKLQAAGGPAFPAGPPAIRNGRK